MSGTRCETIGGGSANRFEAQNLNLEAGNANSTADIDRQDEEQVRAANLSEGYAARTGIDTARARFFALHEGAHAVSGRDRRRNEPPPDTAVDGYYLGAGGRVYPPSTPLSRVPRVVPGPDSEVPRTGETIIYVNGISTNTASQAASLQDIADHTGANVIGVRNATAGFVSDIGQSIGDTFGIGDNPAVETMADTVYEEIKAGRPVHIMAHSQGALVTSRALIDVRNRLLVENGIFSLNPARRREAIARTEAMLGRVKVETFGGAAGSFPDGPQYVHYVNTKDPITVLGQRPEPPLARPGRGAVVYRFSDASNPHGFNETYLPRRVPFEQARRGEFGD